MNTAATSRTPSRALPLAALVLAAAFVVVAPQMQKASQRITPTLENAAPAAYMATGAATLLPYGAVEHDAHVASQIVLPYGAVSHEVTAPSATILPYGAVTTASLPDAITPYGSLSRRAAP